MVIELMSLLHQQKSLVYLIRRECVASTVSQIFLRWEGKKTEEKVGG